MAKQNKMQEQFSKEITSSDYAFIVDTDGDLKAVYMPSEGISEVPDSVRKIFKAMGIKNPDNIDSATVH
jgi:hypothetical protein